MGRVNSRRATEEQGDISMVGNLQWQFAGNVPDNYERYLVPNIFEPWARELIELAKLRPGDRVLDVACGTGIVARTAARKYGERRQYRWARSQRADALSGARGRCSRECRNRVAGGQCGKSAVGRCNV